MSSRVHRGKGKRMEEHGDDEAPKRKRLEENLSNYREPIKQPFIYKVPNYYLRDINDKVHEPRMVAIGPYHHGKLSLNMMEQHKLRYLKLLLLRKNESVDRYISAIAEIEEEARSCYAEDLSYLSSDELTEMLVLDGCFIIELLRKCQMRDVDSSCDSDPIFQMMWFKGHLRHDFILLENQIPFFVMCKLFELINDGGPNQQEEKLIDSIVHFFALGPMAMNVVMEEVRHLLHLKHATQRPSSPIYIDLKEYPPQREYRLIPSATELKDANVTFRKRRGNSSIPFEVEFSNGVLTMSTLSIDDGTDGFIRNLVLYEQYFPDGRPTYVTDYAMMLDCLVNTGRDVELLSQCGIVKNMTGHNEVAADIINRLGQSAMVSQTHFIYGDTFNQINAHHKRRWNRAMAVLNRDYFNSPWAYISIFAALLLLLLTLAQTTISAIQL